MREQVDRRVLERWIGRFAPAIRIRHARTIGMGWGTVVLDVNDAWIFRFPRTAEDARRVDREARLLPELASRLRVAIPRYEYLARNQAGRILFVGYPKLKGRPLPRRGLSGPRADRWVEDLAGMLRTLVRFPQSLGRQLNVEWASRADAMGRWEDLYPKVRRHVHPHLPQGIRAIDREYWESYLDDPESWRRRPVMNHGDLFPEHVLVDDEGITGILDWESACFEDPVANVTGLPVADRFADRVARAVFPSTEPDLERRRAFHRHAVPVYSVLYGLEQNDPARVRRSLALYARTLPVSESEPVSPRRGRTREP